MSAVLLVGAIGGILYLGITRPVEIEILAVNPAAAGGLIEHLDVRLAGLEHQNESLVFAVDWAGNPQRWREVNREIGRDDTVRVRIAPETAMDLPPNLRVGDGQLRPRPFKVRVSRQGESLYTVSPLLSPPAATGALTNPLLKYWDRSTNPSSPFGWYVATQTSTHSAARVGPSASGMGLSAVIERSPNSPNSWVESSLFQIVPSLASCYEVRLTGGNLYQADDQGGPIAATGVQITQNRTPIWWVLSPNREPKITSHADSVFVEVPASKNQALNIEIDIQRFDGQALTIGSEAVVKLFNASSAPNAGTETTSFEWIRPTTCSQS